MNLRLAIKEIRGDLRFSSFFVLNLAIGLLGFCALDAFKTSFQNDIADSSRSLLAGDLSISSRRALTEEESTNVKRALGTDLKAESREWTLYSMATGPKGTRLIQIKAFDENYPLYGHITLDGNQRFTGKTAKSISSEVGTVWVYSEVLAQMGVALGDTIKLGDKSVKITGVVTDESTTSFALGSVAPRVFVSKQTLDFLELVKFGSTVWHAHLYQLSDSANLEALTSELHRELPDPAIRVSSHKASSSQNGRLLQYLSDYLGLVALVALTLSALGAAYLFRSYIAKRLKEIAILLSLGMRPRDAIRTILWQLALLGGAAAILAFLATLVLLPFVKVALEEFSPFDVRVRAGWESFLFILTIGTLGSVFISLPLIKRIRRLRVNSLFQEQSVPTLDFNRWDLVAYLPMIAASWVLAVLQSNSYIVGSLFMVACIISMLFITGVGLAGTSVVGKAFATASLPVRMASRYLSRNRPNALVCFVAIGMGATMLNVIPQLKKSLESEISTPESSKLPSLFLFDIQDEQKGRLEDFLGGSSIEVAQISPLIRSKLVKINGKPFEKKTEAEAMTREQQIENRQRNRGFNLSYRAQLTDSETIVEGEDFPGPHDPDSGQTPLISLERRFAKRLGLGIGDHMEFEVLGVPVSGVVHNIRKIRWTSFSPNFFIQFQPGVLEEAPKTHVASIPALSRNETLSLQNRLVEKFSNVSIIDVSRVIAKVMATVGSMSWILSIMAWLCLASGLVVLYSIAKFQVRMRKKDTALMKILGSPLRSIQLSMLWEFGFLGFFASLFGGLVAIGFGWILSAFIFEGNWEPDYFFPVSATVWISMLAIATTALATRKSLSQKPVIFLQTDDMS